jgi:hypothetical protein
LSDLVLPSAIHAFNLSPKIIAFDPPNAAEDEAARYVLNEFSAAERRDFEARLRDSSELRQVVRELEDYSHCQ